MKKYFLLLGALVTAVFGSAYGMPTPKVSGWVIYRHESKVGQSGEPIYEQKKGTVFYAPDPKTDIVQASKDGYDAFKVYLENYPEDYLERSATSPKPTLLEKGCTPLAFINIPYADKKPSVFINDVERYKKSTAEYPYSWKKWDSPQRDKRFYGGAELHSFFLQEGKDKKESIQSSSQSYGLGSFVRPTHTLPELVKSARTQCLTDGKGEKSKYLFSINSHDYSCYFPLLQNSNSQWYKGFSQYGRSIFNLDPYKIEKNVSLGYVGKKWH